MRVRIATISLLLTTCACLGGPYQRVAGDALLVDRGWGTRYPRYRVEFPPVILTQSVLTSYRAEGLPSGRYMLRLVASVDGKLASDPSMWNVAWDAVDEADGVMAVTLEQRTATIATYSGRLARGWGPAAWGSEHFFTAGAFHDVPLQGDVDLLVSFATRSPLREHPEISVQPVLVAGGWRE